MSAEIIQFVPKPNPNREKAISETLEQMAAKWVTELHDLGDTAPSEYVAPSDDCA